MRLRIFIKSYVPSFIISAYHHFKRFYYRIFGTLYKKYFSKKISNGEFIKFLGFKTVTGAAHYFRERKSPIFFALSENQTTLTKLIRDSFPEIINSTINSGEKISNHLFCLLSSEENNLGKSINWHLDFKSNRHWPLIHPKGININELKKSSDIKTPWELSRCEHLTTLGKAYWHTGNEEYAKEFKAQIDSWMRNNPYGLGINWLCAMEVAIRVCNWIWGWYFFKELSLIDKNFICRFIKTMFQHGVHIEKNLENQTNLTTNHYLSNIAGLLYLGIFFQNTEIGKKWFNFAIKELKSEMKKQVNPDGMNFEGSSCYHRLVLELFFYPTLLTILNDRSFNGDYVNAAKNIFGEDYVSNLFKMFEFVFYTIKPNGKTPQIGDNDNGKLHVFSNKDILDIRYLLNYAAIFFNEPKFKIKEFEFSEDAFWVFGKDGYEKWKNLPENSIHSIKSKAFPDSGIYIMRNKAQYVIISCMPNGQNGRGGHNHNDVLSFELNIDGRDFIIDPGTYNYTGDYKMRNLFRSTSYHNTAVLNGEEINRFKEKEIFNMKNEAKPKALRWETNDNFDILEAEHYGYMRLVYPVIHHRYFFFDKRKSFLRIEDTIKNEGRHTFEILFHFPAIPLNLENETLKTLFPDLPNISIEFQSKEEICAKLKEGWISPSYGIKVNAPYLSYLGKISTPFHFITTIYIKY